MKRSDVESSLRKAIIGVCSSKMKDKDVQIDGLLGFTVDDRQVLLFKINEVISAAHDSNNKLYCEESKLLESNVNNGFQTKCINCVVQRIKKEKSFDHKDELVQVNFDDLGKIKVADKEIKSCNKNENIFKESQQKSLMPARRSEKRKRKLSTPVKNMQNIMDLIDVDNKNEGATSNKDFANGMNMNENACEVKLPKIQLVEKRRLKPSKPEKTKVIRKESLRQKNTNENVSSQNSKSIKNCEQISSAITHNAIHAEHPATNSLKVSNQVFSCSKVAKDTIAFNHSDVLRTSQNERQSSFVEVDKSVSFKSLSKGVSDINPVTYDNNFLRKLFAPETCSEREEKRSEQTMQVSEHDLEESESYSFINKSSSGWRNTSRMCHHCNNCKRKEDCQVCKFCLDKPKYGGPGVKKQKCEMRQCIKLSRHYQRMENASKTRENNVYASE